ncbi:MAG: hypothetical protein ACYC38_05325 [Eubacteriales bacterium]
MLRVKKILAVAICLLFALGSIAAPAFAKGFSSGGRTSFSSGAKGFSSGSKSYSSGGSSFFGKTPSSPSGSSSTGAPATPDAGATGGASSVKGYSTGTKDFSTPRDGSPQALYKDYSTGQKDYSTGRTSYTTGRPSYSGAWDRSAEPESDRFPKKSPVGVFGSPAQSPYYYHNYYWGMPFWYHFLFQPNYYHTPWGYHYFAPRILTWVILLGLLGGGGFFLYRFLAGLRR